MTTKTSPGATSNETSRTAAVFPVLARNSARGSDASGLPLIFSGLGPETCYRFLTELALELFVITSCPSGPQTIQT